ncbi:hypothetical protein [Streptomyces sp. NPDC096153]|uniref:hypothetical protein n=1 Tax=Streptomyces sp. NPDC096153 TaxID=3155548 RepID=UPI003318B746
MAAPEHDAPEQRTQVTQPQPNRILSEPATVQTCRADYEAAADVRARLDQGR